MTQVVDVDAAKARLAKLVTATEPAGHGEPWRSDVKLLLDAMDATQRCSTCDSPLFCEACHGDGS